MLLYSSSAAADEKHDSADDDDDGEEEEEDVFDEQEQVETGNVCTVILYSCNHNHVNKYIYVYGCGRGTVENIRDPICNFACDRHRKADRKKIWSIFQ